MRFIWKFLLLTSVALPAFGAETGDEEKAFLSRTRQLTFEGARSGEGYYSEDGKALIFQSEREQGNPFYQIYILDLETGDSHRVSPGHGKTTCAFIRPNSDDVLFASSHLDVQARDKQQEELDFRASGKQRRYSWDYDETMDIFTSKRDGSGIKRLTTEQGYDAEGGYSPDGSQIVFCSLRHAYPEENLTPQERQKLKINPSYFGEIYIMNADGSNVRRLTNHPGYDGGPFFSADGKRVVWRRFNEKGDQAEVFSMKTDGSDVRQLTTFAAMSWAPYFHSSGEYVIFASNKLGFSNFELYIVDAAGTKEPVRVTHTDGFDGLPVFSPDGKQLCWTSTRTSNEKSQLFLSNWNHDHALKQLGLAEERSGEVWQAAKTVPAPEANPELTPAISEKDLRSHVDYLASDALEGRQTGSAGARLAAEYIAKQLKAAGLQPAGDNGTYFHRFEYNAGSTIVSEMTSASLSFPGHGGTTEEMNVELELKEDFQPLAFSANGEAEGEVVFGGYGLALPQEGNNVSDPFGGTDVKGKVVLVLRYTPEDVEPKRKAELNRYAGLYYKAKVAQMRGAKAILMVTGPNSPNAGKLISLSDDNSQAQIIAASITDEVANTMLIPLGKNLKTLQTALDTENPHAENGLLIPGMRVKIKTGLKRDRKSDVNVVAKLPAGRISQDVDNVVLGAHYDHLGFGREGSSRSNKEEIGQVHNGADDNASGVALILELAAQLAEEKAKNPRKFSRDTYFAFWSGEEMGLLGSSRFTEKPPIALNRTTAYLNFDMVGRLRDNKLHLQGIGSSTAWKGLIEKRNVVSGFDVSLQEDPYLPTDATAFYSQKVPVLAFFTGSHDDYHRPTDDAPTLNYEGLERITKLARLITRDLVQTDLKPEYVKVEKKKQASVSGLRVYLGTVPDYAAEVEGLKLSGVRAGGPADKAGLKGGDIVVEFAGITVRNIDDYMVAFNAVKVGKPAKVIVLRDGKKTELTVVPEGR